ncbi:MAG: HAD family hydrolase [Francisellaceae bacterium]
MGTSCFTDFALAPTARRLLFTAQDYPGLLDLAFRSPCLAADVAHPKPHPEALIEAMSRLEISTADTLFVGDSLADMQAAKAANVMGILAEYGYGAAKVPKMYYNASIETLNDLTAWIIHSQSNNIDK